MSGLRNDFMKVAGSNILLLIASTLNNFVLPIILSISDYANYKTYILYASFCGLFHLGYVDGINIKYGGKEIKDVNNKTFWSEHHFFVLTQLVLTIILLGCAYFSKSLVMALFALTIMPTNMQSFFLFFTQAIGQFSIYAKCVVIVPLFMSIFTCIVFIVNMQCSYVPFCIVHLLCYIISWALLTFLIDKELSWSSKLELSKQKWNHIGILKSGFFIMMGTIVFAFFSTIGRWLIKWNMTDESFAVYSMAASLMGFVLIFVNAVNKVFYPYLCKYNENKKKNDLLVDVLLFLATMTLPFFFLLKYVIAVVLPKYSASIDIVKILLMTLPAVIIIQSYYINLYKAKRLERIYLRDGVFYTIFSIVVNSFAMFLFKDLNVMAMAAVICSYVWFFVPNKAIYQPSRRLQQMVYILSVFLVYVLSDMLFHNDIISFMISITGILVINMVFMKKTILPLFLKK